jgi:hypothetical protein
MKGTEKKVVGVPEEGEGLPSLQELAEAAREKNSIEGIIGTIVYENGETGQYALAIESDVEHAVYGNMESRYVAAAGLIEGYRAEGLDVKTRIINHSNRQFDGADPEAWKNSCICADEEIDIEIRGPLEEGQLKEKAHAIGRLFMYENVEGYERLRPGKGSHQ